MDVSNILLKFSTNELLIKGCDMRKNGYLLIKWNGGYKYKSCLIFNMDENLSVLENDLNDDGSL